MNITDQQVFGVVVGVDGSEHGDTAARYGAVEADRLGVPLDLVHVMPAAIPLAPEHEPVLSEASLQSYATEILDRARKGALSSGPCRLNPFRPHSASPPHDGGDPMVPRHAA